MRQLRESIQINSPLETISEWLAGLSGHHTKWHPDRVSAEWERGEPNQVGSILRAVQDLAGQREVLRLAGDIVRPAPQVHLPDAGPHLDAAPGGVLAIVANDEGSTFTASISYRFGRVTERVFGSRMTAVRRRMREESESLSQIIEAT